MGTPLSILGLVSLRASLQDAHHILDSQVRSRAAKKSGGRLLYVTDFDIIHEFMHTTSDTAPEHLGATATGILASAEGLSFALAPGAAWELLSYCSKLATSSQGFSALVDMSYQRLQTLETDLDENMREELIAELSEIAGESAAAKRLTLFLQSGNLSSLRAVGLRFQPFRTNQDTYQRLLDHMFVERPKKEVSNYCDAANLVTVLAAARWENLFLPLVSNSRAVHDAYEFLRADERLAPPKGLVVRPRDVILRVGFRSASDGQLRQVRYKLASLLEQFDRFLEEFPAHTKPNGLPVDVIFEAQQIAMQLYSVGNEISSLWTIRSPSIPSYVNPKRIAEDLRTAAAHLQVTLDNLLSTMVEKFGEESEHEVGQQWKWALGLKPESNLPRVLVGDTKNHRARGEDSDTSQDAERLLGKLVVTIRAAQISEDSKRQILEGIGGVAASTSKHGKLKGVAKLAWSTIREGIKTIPSALAAWESLRRLWS
jgi:hypothetical protein